jgi:hypothetical protein
VSSLRFSNQSITLIIYLIAITIRWRAQTVKILMIHGSFKKFQDRNQIFNLAAFRCSCLHNTVLQQLQTSGSILYSSKYFWKLPCISSCNASRSHLNLRSVLEVSSLQPVHLQKEVKVNQCKIRTIQWVGKHRCTILG